MASLLSLPVSLVPLNVTSTGIPLKSMAMLMNIEPSEENVPLTVVGSSPRTRDRVCPPENRYSSSGVSLRLRKQLSICMVPSTMPSKEKSSSKRLTVVSFTLATVMFLGMSEPTGELPRRMSRRPLYSPASCSSMGYAGLSMVAVAVYVEVVTPS